MTIVLLKWIRLNRLWGDGSSAVFVDMIKEAGVVEQDAPRNVYAVTKQRVVQEDDKFIAVLPYDGFRITFTVH